MFKGHNPYIFTRDRTPDKKTYFVIRHRASGKICLISLIVRDQEKNSENPAIARPKINPAYSLSD